MAEAFVALGGNVGDVRSTFERAIALLCNGPDVRLSARSSDYQTPPWGITDQPPFINAVIQVATDLEPYPLLSRMQDCERALGRDRSKQQQWGPRTIDLDLLLYDDRAVNDEQLTLPHPRMLERGFVLVPLAEIAPDLSVRGTKVRDALSRIDAQGIEKLPPSSQARHDACTG
jgi:2-amino-4-hydroxy-6-hydroxymethyldihydropteridine diphosphokinase